MTGTIWHTQRSLKELMTIIHYQQKKTWASFFRGNLIKSEKKTEMLFHVYTLLIIVKHVLQKNPKVL